MEEKAGRLQEPYAEGAWCELVSPGMSEAIHINSHQPDFRNMNWARMTPIGTDGIRNNKHSTDLSFCRTADPDMVLGISPGPDSTRVPDTAQPSTPNMATGCGWEVLCFVSYIQMSFVLSYFYSGFYVSGPVDNFFAWFQFSILRPYLVISTLSYCCLLLTYWVRPAAGFLLIMPFWFSLFNVSFSPYTNIFHTCTYLSVPF